MIERVVRSGARGAYAVALLVMLLMGQSMLSALVPQGPVGVGQAASAYIGITHGAHLRPALDYGLELQAFNSVVGKDIGILMYFAPWAPFDPFLLDKLQEQYPQSSDLAVALTWGPDPGSAVCGEGYASQGPINGILEGYCDDYLRSFARDLKSRPERILLRLAHEMNIADVPWWPGHYGNSPSDYVAMWRHIHDIFSAEGVTNVEWVWSPNYASHPIDEDTYAWNDLHAYYPGNDYVDWIALSGYNWGNPWRTFEELYDDILRDLSCRYPKPQILMEVGSVEGPGGEQTKAHWIADMYARLPSYPYVRAVVWFNDFANASRDFADFRVTTSTGDCADNGGCSGIQPISNWTSAYSAAIADSRYTTSLPTVREATPSRTVCDIGSQQLSVTPDVLLLERGESSTVTLSGTELAGELAFTLVGDQRYLSVPQEPLTLSPPTDAVQFSVSSRATTPIDTYELALEADGVTLTLDVKVVRQLHRSYLPMVQVN